MGLSGSGPVLGLAVALAVVAGVSPAGAQERFALPQGEFLFVSPPEGWVLGFSHKDRAKRHIEYIPAGQKVQSWTEMVTVQTFYGLGTQAKGNLNLRGYVLFIAKSFQEKCRETKVEPPDLRRIGRYDSATVAIVCRDPDRTKFSPQAVMRNYEFLTLRAIQGRDALYVVQRAWHDDVERDTPVSSSATLKEWGAFFNQIEICDTRDPALDCRTLGLLSQADAEAIARRQGFVDLGGCFYFRTLTVLPDIGKPQRLLSVMTISFGKGPFGQSAVETGIADTAAKEAGENRPVAVIAGTDRVGWASPAESAANVQAGLAALRDLFIQRGIEPSRIVIRSNPTCRN
jgi:hypothetical protein